MSLFVDTSVWYAAADERDASHVRGAEILKAGEMLVTTDHVLVETSLLLRSRLGRAAADRFWEALRAGVALIEIVGSADLEAAWGIGSAFPDQDFSLVDRTSFAVIQRLGIERVASFDADFAIFRYGRSKNRAFTVVS
ncbi:MAG: PIN domain-containing protein [Bryobacterales bacterium]